LKHFRLLNFVTSFRGNRVADCWPTTRSDRSMTVGRRTNTKRTQRTAADDDGEWIAIHVTKHRSVHRTEHRS